MSSSVSKLSYRIHLTDGAGQPLAGEEVKATLEGDGGFAVNFDAKELKRETDEKGEAVVTWYRRGIFLRVVKATLTVTSSRPDCKLELEPVVEESDGVWISWKKEEFRISRPRV